MASGSEILKELFISLGWQYDEAGAKKVTQAEHKTTQAIEKESKDREIFAKKGRESLQATAKEFLKVAAVAEGVALGITAAVERIAKSFEAAYYAASRSGSSVKEMNGFSYAASQVGSSAEEAQSAVEGLAKAQREMPGYGQMLKGLGASDPRDIVKSLTEIMPRLAAMPYNQAEAYAKALGIPEHLLNAMHDHLEEFKKFQAESNSKYGILGLDPEKAASDGKGLTQLFRTLYDTVQKITELIGSKLFSDLKGPLADLNAFLLAHGKEIADIIAAIAAAIVGLIKGFVEELPKLDGFVKTIGGWKVALEALAAVFTALFVSRIASVLTSLVGISRLAMPPWLLALFGIGAGALAGAEYLRNHSPGTPQGDREEPSYKDAQHDQDTNEGPVQRGWRALKRKMGFEPDGNAKIRRRGTRGKSLNDDYAAGSDEHNLTDLINAEAKRANIDPRLMEGIRAGESGHRHNNDPRGPYDKKDDALESSWGPFQLNRRAGLGVEFERDTAEARKAAGLGDLRDPRTIPMQARWVANYIKSGRSLRPWAGFHGARDANPKWGDSGYVPLVTKKPAMAVPKINLAPLKSIDPNKLKATMGGGQPLGGGSPADNSRKVDLHQTNHVNVTGVSDPTAAAAMIGARQDRHSSTLVRNMQSAIG